jgi:hypothetical protein
MERVVANVLVALLSLAVVRGSHGQDQPATPAEQYKALLKQYQTASGGGALTDAERMQFIGRVYQRRSALALQMVELAEKHPNDPIAEDALLQAVWHVNTTPWPVEVVGQDQARARALSLLERRHVQSPRLGPACQRMSHGFCQEYETFIRAVLAQNPHRDVQALACLSLAHFLNNRRQRLDLIKDQPALAKEFADLFGQEYLADLQRRDRTLDLGEAERLLERSVKEHGQVKLADGGTAGERAKAELYELRHLCVGQHAPDVEGEDQDGKRFKLSDYRGKVVLLDFWHQQ